MNKWVICVSACVAISIVTVVVIIVIINVAPYRHSWRHFADIGIRPWYTYDRLVKRFGEPNYIDFRQGTSGGPPIVHYDGIGFVVSYNRNTSYLGMVLGAVISGPEIRLSRKRIGVGSTREDIEQAYEGYGIGEAPRRDPNGDIMLNISDGKTWFVFTFNDYDIVTRISISFGMP